MSVVIFTHHNSVLADVSEMLRKELRMTVYEVSRATDPAKRHSALRSFQAGAATAAAAAAATELRLNAAIASASLIRPPSLARSLLSPPPAPSPPPLPPRDSRSRSCGGEAARVHLNRRQHAGGTRAGAAPPPENSVLETCRATVETCRAPPGQCGGSLGAGPGRGSPPPEGT